MNPYINSPELWASFYLSTSAKCDETDACLKFSSNNKKKNSSLKNNVHSDFSRIDYLDKTRDDENPQPTKQTFWSVQSPRPVEAFLHSLSPPNSSPKRLKEGRPKNHNKEQEPSCVCVCHRTLVSLLLHKRPPCADGNSNEDTSEQGVCSSASFIKARVTWRTSHRVSYLENSRWQRANVHRCAHFSRGWCYR